MRSRGDGSPEFRLDLSRYELQRNGRTVRLEKQPMELLILLVEKQGRLITRDEIAARLWGDDVFVDAETSVNTAIRKIRLAFNDDPQKPRYIQTVIGKGYRFIGPIEVVPAPAVPEPDSGPPRGTANGKGTGRLARLRRAAEVPFLRGYALLFAVAGLAAAAILAAFIFGVGPGRWWQKPASSPAIRSLAVLPLENLSGDPRQEYFADGMTDELITDLARVAGLRVISRTSVMRYKGSRESLARLVRELGVDAVVEGSVVQSGGRIRITAQLIDARSDRHLWAQSFEAPLEDVLSLQDNLARQITAQIRGTLIPAGTGQSRARAVNPAAHNAYLHGRYAMDRRSGESALRSAQYYREAIALDPGYAPAYAGLARALEAESYLGVAPPTQLMPLARAAALHALQLDSNSGEAYTALGAFEYTYNWDWMTAGRDLQRGIELNPNEPRSYVMYANYLASVGRAQEGVVYARKALRLDPFSFIANRQLGSLLYFAGRCDSALAQLQRARAIEDSPSLVDNWMSWIYEEKGMRDEAVREDLRSEKADGASRTELAAYRSAYAHSGWLGYWRAHVEYLLPRADGTCAPYNLGVSYARLGDRANALHWLDVSITRHCVWDIWMAVDPKLKTFRMNPRFIALLRKMGLPTGSTQAKTTDSPK